MKQNRAVFEIISVSDRHTIDIASSIAGHLENGDVLALSGELGSGKTCFTKGLARGLGVDHTYQITSPTFTLINEYPARYKLYHFDVYRIDRDCELDDLGWEEYLGIEGIVVIEWAEKIVRILPEKTIFIDFEYIGENERRIVIRAPESRLNHLIKDIKTEGVGVWH